MYHDSNPYPMTRYYPPDLYGPPEGGGGDSATLRSRITELAAEHPEYGPDRIHIELIREGRTVSMEQVRDALAGM